MGRCVLRGADFTVKGSPTNLKAGNDDSGPQTSKRYFIQSLLIQVTTKSCENATLFYASIAGPHMLIPEIGAIFYLPSGDLDVSTKNR